MGPCKKIGGMVISVVLMSSSLRHQGSRQHRTLPGVGSYRARPVSIFNINLPYSPSLIITSCTSAIFKILFYYYRYYSTKHSIRSYTSYQGSSRSSVKQSYLMCLGIRQFLLT